MAKKIVEIIGKEGKIAVYEKDVERYISKGYKLAEKPKAEKPKKKDKPKEGE